MKYEIILIKEVSDWDNEEGAGLQRFTALQETTFTEGTEENLRKHLECYGLEFDDFEKVEDENIKADCSEHYKLSVVENGEGIEDKNGKYLADYDLLITKYERV